MNSVARVKFFSGSGPQRIWMSAIVDLRSVNVERSRDISKYFSNRERFLDFARNDKDDDYFTEPAGTMSILLIVMRLVGLLISPCAFRSTGVLPIFSSTSSPLINLPNGVYCPPSRRTGARQMKNC